MAIIAPTKKRFANPSERNTAIRDTRTRLQAASDKRQAPVNTDTPAVDPTIAGALNQARAAQVSEGRDPYRGDFATYSKFAKAQSPTVISDSNLREKVIPEMQADATEKLAKYDNTSAALSQAKAGSEQQKADTKAKDPMAGLFEESADAAVDPFVQKQLDILDRLSQSSDASTRRSSARYKELYDRQRAQQNDVAAAAQGSLGTALNRMGGRYTPGAQGALMAQAQRGNLEKLAQIDDDEMAAIEELRAAQETKDYKLVGEKLDLLKSVRDERLKTLEDERAAVKEEKNAIDNIVIDAAKNGAPTDVKVLIASANTPSEAILAAGDYLQSGTGVLGEYLFYKRQAEAMGQIPLSFDEYQNKDANRKMKSSAGSSGGSVSGNVGISPVGLVDANGKPIKPTATQVEKITSFNDTEGTALEALALMNKGVDTGPVAGRLLQAAKLTGNANEDQLKLEQILGKLKADYIKSISGAAASESEVRRLSKFLPDITDSEQVINSKIGTIVSEIGRNRENFLQTLGAVESVAGTGTNLLETEAQAKDKVDGFYEQTPEQRSLVESLLAQEFTNTEVYEYLKTKGLI